MKINEIDDIVNLIKSFLFCCESCKKWFNYPLYKTCSECYKDYKNTCSKCYIKKKSECKCLMKIIDDNDEY